MSLSKVERIVRAAVVDGNVSVARLARLLQPSRIAGALAYTDGKAIYVSDKFWDLPLSEQYFLVNHEFLHIILNHVERSKNKNKKIYNVAADVVINQFLIDRGRTPPKGACTYDVFKVPKHLTTTQDVYDFLLKNCEDVKCGAEDLIYDYSDNLPEELVKEIEALAKEERKEGYSQQALSERIVAVPQEFRNKVNWFDSLKSQIGRLAVRTNIKTYNRPSRVKVDGCLLRGGFIEQNVPKINIIIDVSSSMGDRPLKIAAKIQAMRGYLKVFKPSYYWLNESWGEIQDITNIPMGGGTNLANVQYIKGADMNVLITDCEDECGVDSINSSQERFYVITNNFNSRIIESDNHGLFKTSKF